MRILMLTPYLPYPLLSGGQIRTFNLLKKLASKHQVTLFALIKEDSERQYIPELEKYCESVKVFKRSKKPFTLQNIIRTVFSRFPFLVIRNHVPETIGAVKEALATEEFDLIHAETFYMMPHIPRTTVPILLVEQTIEYLGYESFARNFSIPILKQLLYVDIAKIRFWEKHYWEACDKLVVMSDNDREFIGETIENIDKIEVVSNGVDTAWFSEKQEKLPENPTVLSVGTFKWLPNVEAVNFLLEEVWPHIKAQIPNAKLWIVGNAPTKKVLAYQEKDESITVSGKIPDIRDAFNQAHVLVAPVFSGKGTRYKILEAMASKRAIVATDIAVEGLNITNGEHVLTSNDAEGIADATIKLLQDAKLRHQLGQNGYTFVSNEYDWHGIAEKLDSIYLEFADS